MQKIKLDIKGMHCASCAMLIEDRLKNKAGISAVKVNHDSGKGVVVYDPAKIKEEAIYETIKSAGDYEVTKEGGKSKEKVQEEEGGEEAAEPLSFSAKSNQQAFWVGLLVGVCVISVAANILLLVMLSKNSSFLAGSKTKTAAAEVVNQPSVNQPTANQPAAVQSFSITKEDKVRGNFDAPVTLVEFSDFECPFCERIYPTFKKILADYPGKVRLVYKYFPLSFHPNAQKASEAGECANEQGKFWEMHDKLFDNQASGFSVDKFKQWAGEIGLKTNQFNDCLDSGKYASKVGADEQEGQAKGVNGTPATFVNGELISGALPYESFKQAIDTILSK